MPPGWEKTADTETGKEYFFNRDVGITTWDYSEVQKFVKNAEKVGVSLLHTHLYCTVRMVHCIRCMCRYFHVYTVNSCTLCTSHTVQTVLYCIVCSVSICTYVVCSVRMYCMSCLFTTYHMYPHCTQHSYWWCGPLVQYICTILYKRDHVVIQYLPLPPHRIQEVVGSRWC